jgi:hypothetical protein
MVPKVDTFALDISDEIKRKNATLDEVVPIHTENQGSIPSSVAPPSKQTQIPWMFVSFVVVGIVLVSALTSFLYSSYQDLTNTTPQPELLNEIATSEKKNTSIAFLSPTLSEKIERYITSVEKKEKGVVITFSSYSAVFGYMTKNETEYIHEIVEYFFKKPVQQTSKTIDKKVIQKPVATTTPKTVSSSTPQKETLQATSSSKVIATSSQEEPKISTFATNTSTQTGTTTPVQEASFFNALFRDITLSNVNIRAYNGINGSVAYAFISENKLVIAPTADDVVTIKNMVIR